MKRKGNLWIAAGLLLIAAALFLTTQNVQEDEQAAAASREIMEELVPKLVRERPKSEVSGLEILADPDMPKVQEIPEMPVVSVNGNDYICIITIPELDLELPVHSRYELPKLRSAPCRYSGSIYKNDIVICAHNYNAHFGLLKNLSIGDAVILTDMYGNVFHYIISEFDVLNPEETDYMLDAKDWDLTLFTCTIGGATRVTVRCIMIDE